jgi:hypothetical protein
MHCGFLVCGVCEGKRTQCGHVVPIACLSVWFCDSVVLWFCGSVACGVRLVSLSAIRLSSVYLYPPLLSVVCGLSSVVCPLSSIICRLSSVVCGLSSVVCGLWSVCVVCRLCSVVYGLSVWSVCLCGLSVCVVCLSVWSVCLCGLSVCVVCLSVWSVYLCGLSVCVVCLSVWSVYLCGLSVCVVCLSVWSVCLCGLSVCVVCLSVWSVCLCGLSLSLSLSLGAISAPLSAPVCTSSYASTSATPSLPPSLLNLTCSLCPIFPLSHHHSQTIGWQGAGSRQCRLDRSQCRRLATHCWLRCTRSTQSCSYRPTCARCIRRVCERVDFILFLPCLRSWWKQVSRKLTKRSQAQHHPAQYPHLSDCVQVPLYVSTD